MANPKRPRPSLMPLRTAVVLLFSVTIACAIGTLTYVEKGTSTAALAAISAFATSALWLDKVIAP